MKLNINKYVENVFDIAKNINQPEFISIILKRNASKVSNGSFQLSIIIRNNNTRKKNIYSIYINEFNFEEKLRTSVMIVDSSSYNYNMLFSNASDASIEKSYKYITKIINGGIEKLQRVPKESHKSENKHTEQTSDNDNTTMDD